MLVGGGCWASHPRLFIKKSDFTGLLQQSIRAKYDRESLQANTAKPDGKTGITNSMQCVFLFITLNISNITNSASSASVHQCLYCH